MGPINHSSNNDAKGRNLNDLVAVVQSMAPEVSTTKSEAEPFVMDAAQHLVSIVEMEMFKNLTLLKMCKSFYFSYD